jgi:PAS domain S-box-containing protein
MADKNRPEISPGLPANRIFLQSIVEAIEDIVIVYDLVEQCSVYSNRQMYEILGYTLPQLVNMEPGLINKVIHPEDVARLPVYIQRMDQAEDGETIELEFRALAADGEWRWLLSRNVVFTRSQSGRPVQILSINQDITSRKQEQAEINHLASFPEMNPNPIFELTLSGEITYCNPAARRILQELGMENSIFLLLPTDIDEILKECASLAAQDKPAEFYRQVRIQERVFRQRLYLMPDLAVLRAYTSDITAHLQAEERRAFQAGLLSRVHDAIIATDADFKIIYWNQVAEELYGWTEAEVIGRFSGDIFKTKIEGSSRQEGLNRLLSEDHYDGEVQYLCKDGNYIFVDVRSVTLRGKDGELQGVVTSTRDITQRKQAEAQIKNALQEKETLLRELYHRTKNNMNVIGALLTLQAEQSNDEKITRVFHEIEDKIQAMALVHQMLYQSKDLSRIDFREYIARLAERLMQSHKISAEDVSLQIEMEEMLAPIDTAMPCGLVINELFTNAFRHAFPEGRKGWIHIKVTRTVERDVDIIFTDNGIGLPGDFDFRGQTTLGLQSIFIIVEHQLQGKVWFENHQGITCHIQFNDALYRSRI